MQQTKKSYWAERILIWTLIAIAVWLFVLIVSSGKVYMIAKVITAALTLVFMYFNQEIFSIISTKWRKYTSAQKVITMVAIAAVFFAISYVGYFLAGYD